MKKIVYIVLASIMAAFVLSGCSAGHTNYGSADPAVKYVTKYVTNIDKLDIREQPNNAASIICSIDKNASVSFIEDSDNGYSKIVYNGVTGYALSSYLTQQEPANKATAETHTGAATASGQSHTENYKSTGNENSAILSSRSDSEIESYITSYVRPLYNEVNSNIDNYSASSSNGVKYWYDNNKCIKKTFAPDVNNYGYAREYYYDTDSGRIAFAFVYSGTTEYRLYFRENQLVRFIPPGGNAMNNPRSNEAITMGSYVLSEAY